MNELIPQEVLEKKIYLIRGQKVMFDKDLAALYGVETKVLNQAVKRNMKRFPPDFTFQLGQEDAEELSRSQFVTLKTLKRQRDRSGLIVEISEQWNRV